MMVAKKPKELQGVESGSETADSSAVPSPAAMHPAALSGSTEDSSPAAAAAAGAMTSSATTDFSKKTFVFKNPNFEHSMKSAAKKKSWKTLKQIISAEQVLNWPDEAITYSSIDAPPSFRPSKKYSDISGLESIYTDPQSKMNYSTTEEFKMIRKLPSDIVAGYLTLRRANTQLQ